MGKMISEQIGLISQSVQFPFGYHNVVPDFRQEKTTGRRQKPPPFPVLSLAERLAVGALIHSGVGFMGAHQDLVQGTVVLILAVVSAGFDGAFDTLVCMAVHSQLPPLICCSLSLTRCIERKHGKHFLIVAFSQDP